jgi:hypothetical protein
VARTAVITKTATTVAGNSAQKQANAAAAQQAEIQTQAQVAEMQSQLNAMQAQQPAAPASAPAGSDDMMAKLQQLADMKANGILSDEEFTTAKARLLTQ